MESQVVCDVSFLGCCVVVPLVECHSSAVVQYAAKGLPPLRGLPSLLVDTVLLIGSVVPAVVVGCLFGPARPPVVVMFLVGRSSPRPLLLLVGYFVCLLPGLLAKLCFALNYPDIGVGMTKFRDFVLASVAAGLLWDYVLSFRVSPPAFHLTAFPCHYHCSAI